MLLLTKVDLISIKKKLKQNLIRLNSFSYSKVVFILLTKVKILYVRPITINVGQPGLERFFSSFFFLVLKLERLCE